ncbi:alpha/beta hydrolase [Thalassobius sp. S69A]|uniref:alpha/beta hydrolase n=1 Tax=unclassified Thalassovita TaxID=2619711 RepID=UPI000C54FCB8|nr:alpha/beta hydrolase [Paracoccaceae bacterium]
MRRWVFRLTLLGALLLAAIAAASQAERWLFYPFDPRHVAPAQAGLSGVTETRLDTPDGKSLIVWSAPAQAGQPVILYFHGNAGNLAVRAGRFQHFLDRGYGLIAPAYRGSSGSSGTPSEATLTADARLIYDRMKPPGPVVVYGESLGTAVAISLVAGLDRKPAGLLLEAPFTSIKALARAHYPALADYADKLQNKWPSRARAGQLSLPLFILHGTQDELIPHKMGKAIYKAAPGPRKTFYSVKGGGHTDLWRSTTLPRIWRFIDGL